MRSATLLMLSALLASSAASAQTANPAPNPAPAPPAPAPVAGPPPPPAPPLDVRRLQPVGTLIQSFVAAPKIRGLAKIFDQQIAYRLPRGFSPVAEEEARFSYAVLLTGKEETYSNWTTQVNIAGYSGFARVDGLSAKSFAEALTNPDNPRCKAHYFSKDLGSFEVDGYSAQLFYAGCARSRVLPGDTAPEQAGEVAVVMVIKGVTDMYTVQAMFRGQMFNKDTPPINDANARQVADQLMPIAVCAISLTTPQCMAQQAQAQFVPAKPLVIDPALLPPLPPPPPPN
jgi:hypothetical protein